MHRFTCMCFICTVQLFVYTGHVKRSGDPYPAAGNTHGITFTCACMAMTLDESRKNVRGSMHACTWWYITLPTTTKGEKCYNKPQYTHTIQWISFGLSLPDCSLRSRTHEGEGARHRGRGSMLQCSAVYWLTWTGDGQSPEVF